MALNGVPVAAPRLPRLRARPKPAALAVVGLVLVAIAGLAYALARTTSLFAVSTIEVLGATPEVDHDVTGALERFRRTSLVGLDLGAVERAAKSVPAVRSVEVERDFPRALRVVVRTEEPVAVVRQADAAWLVAASGKVLESVEVGELETLPRVWLPPGGDPIAPPDRLPAEAGGLAVGALAQVPSDFPARVRSAAGTDGDLTLVIAGKTELRLGEARDIRLKLAVAATVLESLTPGERRRLAYLDLSLPVRPVSAEKAQVEA